MTNEISEAIAMLDKLTEKELTALVTAMRFSISPEDPTTDELDSMVQEVETWPATAQKLVRDLVGSWEEWDQ